MAKQDVVSTLFDQAAGVEGAVALEEVVARTVVEKVIPGGFHGVTVLSARPAGSWPEAIGCEAGALPARTVSATLAKRIQK